MIAGDNFMGDHPRPPLDVAAGAEQRDHRRLHCGRDVHGRGINADEEFCLRSKCGEFFKRKLAR